MKNVKPIKRTQLRITLGKLYYTYRRYIDWYFSGKKYSKKRSKNLLPIIVFEHKTPLYRKLKNVDMWMQYNKVNNLKIAVSKLNGVIIKPGEIFSYWKLIGKPTRRKGYLDGMVLFYGGFKAGVGGGLCQLSNLIYWMTLHTPLTVIERYRHSYDVFPDSNRTQPFGSGATCVYNYRDLQIFNDTDVEYQLHVYLTDEYLVGQWRSVEKPIYKYRVYEKKHWITHEYWGGYVRHNIIHREKLDINGNLIDDEYITENHAIMMYQPFLEGNFAK
ncbi:vancomycin resistance protein VanW [Caminicella sporogenes DSM 14501]|uniref:Vancomycin resistance protein VanW n=1 Tax=Caminicella sporogenes DSM 14501 TaxID=1121266 RepID=A0A1M6NEE7_9FIRM|nr:VanW family protein [Caminicella sporogenes]RKD22227.1 vancomycin resistance protein [Caminicella sporogenes]SHJ94122.1 vancomycin resistance protein VanW [Caminicella sporogenes DSM 14501]